MKEKTQITNFPNPIGDLTIYSEETKHLFSKADQKLFETLPYKMPTNSKYLKAQKRLVIYGIEKIFEENPDMPLRQVIIKKLSTMPDFLPADNLLKVVGYITETWEQCHVKTFKKAS